MKTMVDKRTAMAGGLNDWEQWDLVGKAQVHRAFSGLAMMMVFFVFERGGGPLARHLLWWAWGPGRTGDISLLFRYLLT